MDIEGLLKEQGISVSPEGSKNVGKNSIGIQCPFCDDPSNHLRINKRTLKIKCWRCGPKNIYSLLNEITDLSKREIRSVVKSLSRWESADLSIPPKVWKPHQTAIPAGAKKYFPKGHIKFLKDRGFSDIRIKEIKKKYNLYAVHIEGKYRYRIIIPIYMNNKLVAYTSRDVTGKQEPKYLTCKEDECLVSPDRLIYNYDSIPIGGNAIASEGPIDVWVLGDGSFATLGTRITTGQMIMLSKKKINRLFSFFDDDLPGWTAAYRFSKMMSPIVKKIEIIRFKNQRINDPGQLKETEVERIKQEVGFYEV